jgi:hypothetical protein
VTDFQTIFLDSADDIVSICDRLDWAAGPQVLLVLPEDDGAVLTGLDLVRLRRHADRRRLEIGLVTAVTPLARQAKALGIPAFATVEEAQAHRRGWWHGRRRRELVGLPLTGHRHTLRPQRIRPLLNKVESPAALHRQLAPLPTPRQWLWRYLGILLFFVVAAFAIVGFMYVVPQGEIVFAPETQPAATTFTVTADPSVTAVNFTSQTIPARRITLTQTWQAETEATGRVAVPSANARGTVVFTNLTAEPVTIPAGSRVVSSVQADVVFTTVETAVVPGVVGGTVETAVVADAPGEQGNIAANVLDSLDGPFGDVVLVRNLAAMQGGGTVDETAVTEGDRERLRAEVLQFLQALAAAEMEAQLSEQEFLARPSLQVTAVNQERYSHEPGELADTVQLEMTAVVAGTAVDTSAIPALAFAALADQVPDGFVLKVEDIHFEIGQVLPVDAAGQVQVDVTAEGTALAEIPVESALTAVAGQPLDAAAAYLYDQLPLSKPPQLTVQPGWFQRVPYLPARVAVTIEQ